MFSNSNFTISSAKSTGMDVNNEVLVLFNSLGRDEIKCKSCAFTYIGQTKRCWCSRWLEHKSGV